MLAQGFQIGCELLGDFAEDGGRGIACIGEQLPGARDFFRADTFW